MDRAGELGMTLVEALTALFIMGLASSMIILTMPERPAPIVVASTKLADMAETARRSALVRGNWTGVAQTSRGYQIVSYRNGAWQATSGQAVEISGELTFSDDEERPEDRPVFRFGPTGSASEESVTLTVGANERIVSVSHDGNITIASER